MIPELKNYTKKRLSAILHNVMKEWESRWTSITELATLNELYGDVIGRLWEKSLVYCRTLNPATEPCSAEEVVAAIIRKGLKKDSIKFRGHSFILSLPNHSYEIRKIEGRFNARPMYGQFSYQDYSSQWITMEKDDFADFLFEFDSTLPAVKDRISNCIYSWMPHVQRQCRIAEGIKALAEKYLLQERIKCEIQVFKNGSPKLRFSKGEILPMERIVDPEELEEFFREVPELMSKRPICRNYYMFYKDSGTVTAYLNWEAVPTDERKDVMDYFTKDDYRTKSRISNLSSKPTVDGTVRIIFDFDGLDWVHMFWDLERKFPNLKARYMVVTEGRVEQFAPDTVFTNDSEGKYFRVDDRRVKVVNDFHEIREDCEVDKTSGMTRFTCEEMELCFPFDEEGDDSG